MQLIEEEELVHANHFIHQAFQAQDELNPLASIFSRQRELACHDRLKNLPPDAEWNDYFKLLSSPPIYVCPKNEIKREETVAMAVIKPHQGLLCIQKAGADFFQTINLFEE